MFMARVGVALGSVEIFGLGRGVAMREVCETRAEVGACDWACRGRCLTVVGTKGNLDMKARRLSLPANSEARATLGQALLSEVLGDLVRAPLIERADLGQSLTEARQKPPQPPGMTPEVERQVISKALDDHYRHILAEQILTLGNRSPRSAAKAPKGREKVMAWLKRLENHGAGLSANDPMTGYDSGWLWRELGVEHLRR